MARPPHLPEKLFFKIGEVADLVGVKPHVLRYWESEFQALRPMKTRGSHRVYKRRDVEIAMLIRQLLHDEGFTIPGARKRIRELRRELGVEEPEPRASREVGLRSELLAVREVLLGLLEGLDGPVAESPDLVVTLHQVVPSAASRTAR